MKQELLHKQNLPDGWKWSTLGEECNLKIGGTPSRGNAEYFKGKNLWVSVRDLNGRIITDTQEKITDEALQNSNVKLVKKGTVLICFKLSLGKKAIAGRDLYTNEAIAALEIKPESQLIEKYLFFYLDSINLFDYANTAAKGSCLNKASLSTVKILVPTKESQEKIVSKLDIQIAQIETMKKESEKEKEAIENMMQSYIEKLFSKEYPEISLNEIILSVRSGISREFVSTNVGLPVVRSTNISLKKSKIDFSEMKYWYEKDPQGDDTSKYLLDQGDILLNFINSPAQIGKVCIYKSNFKDCIYTTNIFRIKLDQNRVSHDFFRLFSLTNFYRKQIGETTKKAVNQASFTQKDLKNIKIKVPPITEQNNIVKKFELVEAKVEDIQKSINLKISAIIGLPSAILNEIFGKYILEERNGK